MKLYFETRVAEAFPVFEMLETLKQKGLIILQDRFGVEVQLAGEVTEAEFQKLSAAAHKLVYQFEQQEFFEDMYGE